MSAVSQSEKTKSIQVIRLKGGPFERGVAHGEAVADRLEYYWGELIKDVSERSADPISKDELRDWILERCAPALAIAPDLEEEIQGLAAGAGVDYEVALAVNLGEEVCHLASARGVAAARPTERCLSIVVPPEQSSTGDYLLAQTWDGPDWTPDPVLFVVDEASGRSAYLSDGGWVGGVGLNDRAIGSVHTGVGTTNDGTPGLPYPFIARRILQSDSPEEACSKVVEAPATAGCHYIVAGGGHALDVEIAGEANAVVPLAGPISTCAHFSASELEALETEDDARRVSEYRTTRLLSLLSERSPISPLELFDLMSDHFEGPSGAMVCRHPTTDRVGGRSLGALVVDMAAGEVFARAGNPCERRPFASAAVR